MPGMTRIKVRSNLFFMMGIPLEPEQDFLQYLEVEKQASPHTVEVYARALRQFRAWAADSFPGWENCTPDQMRDWLFQELKDEAATSSIRLRFAALRSFYRFMMRRHGLETNPMTGVSLPRKKKTLPVFLTLNQMLELLELPYKTAVPANAPAWLPYRDAAILELFYSCGMRLSELVGLDVGSVDHRFRGVKVMGKGHPACGNSCSGCSGNLCFHGLSAEEFSLVCLPYRNPVKRSLRADDAEQICEAVFHSFYHFSP